MLARAATTIPYPSRTVVAALVADDHEWRVSLDGNGGQLLARVGVDIGPLPVYKHVRLEIGRSSAVLLPDMVMLPVSWVAVGGPPIFPRMEGTLHAKPDGPDSTTLTLNASYDPPLGALGALIDRMLMHRLAAMTMTNFIDRLGQAVGAEIAKAGPAGAGV